MGHVYRAKHEVMGREVAIKVLNGELAQDAAILERFINEARAVNDIRHPHVVEITDFGQVDGVYYLIMELLEGETLTDYMNQCGALPELEAVRLAIQITSALDAAHERGIIHRDLKPDNIFLVEKDGDEQFVKVLDFGVAKVVGPNEGTKDRLTAVGALLGTPHYMSPEQCLGEASVGPQSDVYSLGVMLYELVCGELPFDSDNLSKLLLAHINEAPRPPRDHIPDLPEYVSETILRALHKKPEQRLADMREFRAALLRDPRMEDGGHLAPRAPAEPRVETPAPTSQARGRTGTQRGGPAPKRPTQTAARKPPKRSVFERANTMVAARTRMDEVQDINDRYGLSRDDEARPQRVGNKLASIIQERVKSQNLVLPTMPQVAMRCIDLVSSDKATFGKIANTLEQDPLLAAQILKVANSVAFVSAEKARTVEQAVSRLGARQLRMLLIELSAHQVFQSRKKRIRDAFDGIWQHSLAVALLTKTICTTLGNGPIAETAHLAGLLHDLGKPMVGSMLLEAERSLSAREEEFMTPGLWMQVVEDSHREVGQAIATGWKMPEEVGQAIEFCGEYDVDTPAQIRNFVTLGNALAKKAGYCLGTTEMAGVDALIDTGMQIFELDPEQIEMIVETVADQVKGHVDG